MEIDLLNIAIALKGGALSGLGFSFLKDHFMKGKLTRQVDQNSEDVADLRKKVKRLRRRIRR